jgi:hypothetical protein
MSKEYTPEEAARILAESRAILARPLHPERERREERTATDNVVPLFASGPTETRNQRDARELGEKYARWEAKRAREENERERRRERRERRFDAPAISYSDIDARIASALAAERRAVIPALRAAVDELLKQERKHAVAQMTEQMRSLELQVAKLESALGALQSTLSVERAVRNIEGRSNRLDVN